MIDLTEAGLVQLAQRYYPPGFPIATDDYSQELHPYQRTPEYGRWMEAWDRALAWKEWTAFIKELGATFGRIADSTQPRMSSCRKCCIYVERALSDGSLFVTRVAAAVSILTPLYVTFCTTAVAINRREQDRTFSFEPTEEVREHSRKLAELVEGRLGAQPFPLQLANVPLRGLRVFSTFVDEAPLLHALFDADLANLF
jgi:hypothetical protein